MVDTEDLDALVEDSQAKKTKQATQWAVSVFTGRSQLRFEMVFFTQVFPTSLIFPKKKYCYRHDYKHQNCILLKAVRR